MRGIAIFVIAVIFAYVQAAPESGADCYDKNLKITVKRGEDAYPEGQCLRVSCSNEGKFQAMPCEFAIPPGCKVVDGDRSKKYPSCCPTLECKK